MRGFLNPTPSRVTYLKSSEKMLSVLYLSARREAVWPVTLAAVALAGAVHLSLAREAPSGALTVVFPPWISRLDAVARATRNARLVALGALPGVIEVRPDGPSYDADGAWIVLPGAPPPPCAQEARQR